MAKTSSSPFTVQIVAPQPPPTKSFQLTSVGSGTDLPFTIGYAFRKGDIPSGTTLTLDAGTAQVLVKRSWNDGSVKHAVVSGHVTLVANVAKDIQVVSPDPGSAFPTLTSANIVTAAPTASVACGVFGTVTLTSLLAAAPFRTWVSGPEMVECHYRAAVGADATLVVWFHVRLYRKGRIWIRAICENGYLPGVTGGPTNSDKAYVPTVTIGGATVYNNGGAPLTHYAHTRWNIEGWIGVGGDPQVTPRHNTAYLMDTKLAPNYWKRNPSATALSNLYQNYSPMQKGDWTVDMGATGEQSQIGLLPLWDALYVNSGGDAQAYRSVIANAKALNSYAILWNDSATKMPTIPSNRPTYTIDGPAGGGATQVGAGTLIWDVAHHGSGGYLAYLITGDYYYLETMEDQASICYLINSSTQGSGTSRILGGQTRAVAWCLRTIGQLAAIGPSDPVVNDYRTLLSSNAVSWDNERQRAGQNLIGYLYDYEIDALDPVVGKASPFQQHFWVQTFGYLSDLEPLANMGTWNLVRDFLYKSVVGILGSAGASEYCYTQASAFKIQIASDHNGDATTWYDSWGTVYQATFGAANGTCGTTLQGTSGSDPANASTGYYGNLMPAIAYAVDHVAPGADLAFTRLTGASNWNVVENSGFGDIPIWGIVPRGSLGT
jgi:hypothetical protein